MPVADGGVGLGQRIRDLVHGRRFAGQRRLLHAQIGRLDEPRVRGDGVARLQDDDIARHEPVRLHLLDAAVAAHLYARSCHLLERRHRLLGPVLLRESEDRVEHDDDQDRDGVLDLTQKAGDNSGNNEDDDHRLLELVQQDQPGALDAAVDQLVGAEAGVTLLGLGGCQALRRVHLEPLHGLVRGKGVPG